MSKQGKTWVWLITLALFLAVVVAMVADAAEVHLSWECPTCESEGVTGFRIFYGLESRDKVFAPEAPDAEMPYTAVVLIADGKARSHTLRDLTPGTYYFRMTTRLDGGTESLFSKEITGVSLPTPPEGVTVFSVSTGTTEGSNVR